MKHSLSDKVNPWQLILSSRGPRAVQEFQVKLPLCGDFKLCALKKRLSLKLNISRFRPYRIILPRQGGSINIIQVTVYSFTVPALN